MRNLKKNILTIFVALLACVCAHAQQAVYHVGDSLALYFRQGDATFDPDFENNGQRCSEFIQKVDRLRQLAGGRVAKVTIFSSASPEGDVANNEKLAQNRAKNAINYLHNDLQFADSVVFIQIITEDWEGLARKAAADDNVPYKAQALEIIKNSQDPQRKENLRKLEGGAAWNYLYSKYFPHLRSFRIHVYVDPRIDAVASDIKIEQIESCYIAPDPFESEIGNILNVKPVPMPVQPQWQSEITVKTNFLGWALLHGNIAVEYDIIPHLSVALPFYYSGGLDYIKETIKFRGIVLQPEVRYYLKDNDGFWGGAHFGLGWYNFALDREFRIQDHKGRRPAIGGGISLGYAMKFKKQPRWGLEFALGAGVYDVVYDIFYNEPNGAYAERGMHDTWFGIDNFAVSLTYSFPLKKKEGRK
jgi:hypothetical protein